mmetsp:Transcript_7052/g.20038  ORF Transcript_7052/g.20038 Transcript_7052/m.20038 type:complete len:603 (-) Transcript_7052:10-1818(-)
MAGRRPSTGADLLDADYADVGRFNPKGLIAERVGAEISKRYDINTKEIGSGGYGKVFVARDREMQNRTVAIKKVLVLDESKKKAFQKEANIMKQLDHPNICKLLETYEQGRFMFFVMEYCEGREVFDRIMDHGQIEEKTTADIVRQCASALKYAHDKGIAHRDMKPENICFCSADPKDNRIKVIDWGLGFYFGQARMSSAVGSLTYAAPEVLESKEVEGYSSACDLWSLGVVSYVMLCGKPPFWGAPQDHLRNAAAEKYPMKSGPWATMPEEAISFVRQLLKANPEERMTCADATEHPWLKSEDYSANRECSAEVLQNLSQFSDQNLFMQFCITAVARQLDHRHLRDIHQVFREMDQNGDGTLSVEEIGSGLRRMFGEASEECKKVEELFERLDLNGSGAVDYTEFCAAGIGERMSTEEHVLWAAFKAFDVQDDDGRITKEEIKQVLLKAGVDKFWTTQVCEELSDELFSRYDKNGDGSLDFQEFAKLMREIAKKHTGAPSLGREADLIAQLETGATAAAAQQPQALFKKAYSALVEMDRSEGGQKDARNRNSASEGPRAAGAKGTRAVSGSLAAMTALRHNTPTCFSCSADSARENKCSVM